MRARVREIFFFIEDFVSVDKHRLGAVQKLRNDQRGGEGRRFCYILLRIFEGEGVFYEIVT